MPCSSTAARWARVRSSRSSNPRCRSARSGYTCLKDWHDTSRTTSADADVRRLFRRHPRARVDDRLQGRPGMRDQSTGPSGDAAEGAGTGDPHVAERLEIHDRHGAGVPRHRGCDTRYYGFFNQVYGAAWQLKRYANPAGTSRTSRGTPRGTPGTSGTTRTPDAVPRRCTSRIRRLLTSTTTRLTSRTRPPCAPDTARATDAPPTATATSTTTSTTGSLGAGPDHHPLDTSSYVIALDGAGVLWGYPYGTTGGWGPPRQIGALEQTSNA